MSARPFRQPAYVSVSNSSGWRQVRLRHVAELAGDQEPEHRALRAAENLASDGRAAATDSRQATEDARAATADARAEALRPDRDYAETGRLTGGVLPDDR